MFQEADRFPNEILYVFTVNGNAEEALELLKKSKGNVMVKFE